MSRKIDALIAEHIMGLVLLEDRLHHMKFGDMSYAYPIPKYSTDLAMAWDVMESLDYLWCEVGRESVCGVRYDANLYNRDDCTDKVNITADTAAMAICKAILKHKGISYA